VMGAGAMARERRPPSRVGRPFNAAILACPECRRRRFSRLKHLNAHLAAAHGATYKVELPTTAMGRAHPVPRLKRGPLGR